MTNLGFASILLGVTICNIIFDYLFERLGTNTISWQGGAVTAITIIWFVENKL
jgi:hypothetical protein